MSKHTVTIEINGSSNNRESTSRVKLEPLISMVTVCF